MDHARPSAFLLGSVLVVLAACSRERVVEPLDAARPVDGEVADNGDAPSDAGDGPSTDAAWVPECSLDVDCDDGVFCNGMERCEAADVGAERCVPGAAPCTVDECAEAVEACLPPCVDGDGDGARVAGCSDAVGPGTDCNDLDPSVAPGLADICNRVDDDCDSVLDEDAPSLAVYADGDSDGYGAALARMGCAAASGESLVAGDCRDDDASIYPGADERCNAIDDDCDGALGAIDDADSDGFPAVSCGGADCDDANPAVFPGAPERCNGLIDDCRAGVGAAPGEDGDGDGHAPVDAVCLSRTTCASSGAIGCDGVFEADDCDDADPTVYPRRKESCDGVDSDCSAGGGRELTEDADGDGYVAVGATCVAGPLAAGDCDDTRADVSPAATEVCNGRDDDCTGLPEAGQPMPNCDSNLVCGGDGFCGAYRKITPSRYSVYAIRYDGRLVEWPGSYTPEGYPTVVESVPVPVVDIKDASLNACALGVDGSVWCVGSNLGGLLGTAVPADGSSDVFVRVPGLSGARELALSGTGCVTLTSSVTCWGRTFVSGGTVSRTPWSVPGSGRYHGLQTGDGMFCAIDSAARVVCWGNRADVIAPGTPGFYVPRATVASRSPAGAAAVAFGDVTGPCTLLRADGSVVCWGTPTTTYWPGGVVPGTPGSGGISLVLGIGRTISTEGSSVSGCVLRADHTARCWTWAGASDQFPEGILELSASEYVRRRDGRVSRQAAPNLSLPIPSVVRPFRIEPGRENTMVVGVDGSVFYTGRAPGSGGETTEFRYKHVAAYRTVTGGPTKVPQALQVVQRGLGGACYLDMTRTMWCVDGGWVTPFGDFPVGVLELTAGETHVCGLDTDGLVWCDGTNYKGQMGVPPGDYGAAQLTEPATSFDAGGDHTCAAGESGAVWCWGVNTSGELGAPPTPYTWQPTTVPGIDDAVGVAAGERHSCALRADTTVWCWGANDSGQLGTAPRVDRHTAAQVPGLVDVVAISAGRAHSCALHADGAVSCWGNNWYGQLGAGTLSGVTGAARVVGLTSPVIDLRVGFDHSCAITSDGRGWCWGHNEGNKLGDGTTLRRSRPVQMWASPR